VGVGLAGPKGQLAQLVIPVKKQSKTPQENRNFLITHASPSGCWTAFIDGRLEKKLMIFADTTFYAFSRKFSKKMLNV
jgi:hypothetical protein